MRMRTSGKHDAGVSIVRARRRAGRSLVAFAVLIAHLSVRAAIAGETAPVVSPDRIEDAPSIQPAPYPDFDNFAWRAFIAPNCPSLTDPAHRARPTPARTLV